MHSSAPPLTSNKSGAITSALAFVVRYPTDSLVLQKPWHNHIETLNTTNTINHKQGQPIPAWPLLQKQTHQAAALPPAICKCSMLSPAAAYLSPTYTAYYTTTPSPQHCHTHSIGPVCQLHHNTAAEHAGPAVVRVPISRIPHPPPSTSRRSITRSHKGQRAFTDCHSPKPGLPPSGAYPRGHIL